MIQKFRRLPATIEAVQFEATYQNAQEIIDWINTEVNFDPKSGFDPPVMYYYGDLTFRTKFGDLHMTKGDWIIKDVSGEFFPVKADVFERTYKHLQPERTVDLSDTDFHDNDWFRYRQVIDRFPND